MIESWWFFGKKGAIQKLRKHDSELFYHLKWCAIKNQSPIYVLNWHFKDILTVAKSGGLFSYLTDMRAYQSGTVGPCTSRGIKDTTIQSWNVYF